MTAAAVSARRPRGRIAVRAVTAALAFAAAAYLFYYLSNLPQSAPIKAGDSWTAVPGQQVRLAGFAPGALFAIQIRDPASIQLTFDPGARLRDAAAASAAPANGRLLFSLINAAGENATVTLTALEPTGSARPMLSIDPVQPDPAYLSLRIRAEASPLQIDFQPFPSPTVRPDPAHPGRPLHGSVQLGADTVLEEASVIVPAGVSFSIGIPAKLPNLRVDAGTLDIAGEARLPLTRVEIGDGSDDGFERRAAACGAPAGRVLWRHPVPGLDPRDCAPGRLSLAGMAIGEGVGVSLRGSGFVVRDGVTQTWPGFRDLIDNDVVKVAIGGLITSLVSWVFLALLGRKPAPAKEG